MSYRDFTYEQIAATFEYDPETGSLAQTAVWNTASAKGSEGRP
jgi:hypothetical protein